MYLAYDGIVFDVLLLNSWDQNAIWSDDGVDFLYWHHLIDVTCIINPNVVAADTFPPLQRQGVNTILKATLRTEAARQTARDQKARLSGQTRHPDGAVPGVPTKTKIPPPTGYRPRTDLDPKSLSSLKVDSTGQITQVAEQGVPSYPPARYIAPGILYSDDLANQTGPIQEPGVSANTVYGNQTLTAPATIEDTSTGDYGSNPDRQLIYTPTNIIDDVIRFVVGAQPPGANPTAVPPLILDHRRPPPGPGKRTRFPTNANLPASDIELRDRLQVPRRKLKVWVNTGPGGAPEFILNLPYPGCSQDANAGPKCVDMNMTAIHGNITGVKRIVFECFECLPISFKTADFRARLNGPNGPSSPGIQPAGQADKGILNDGLTPPILSNRWTMKQVPDPQTYLNSTVISGKAVFRMDILSAVGITADQLRSYIMPPLATGYVRRPVEVAEGSAGNEILYTIVDDQQMMNNPAGQRWGVHSVTIIDSMVANNPLDAITKVNRSERGR